MTDFALSSGSICRPYRSPWGAFPTKTFQTASTTATAIALGRPLDCLADTSSNAGFAKAATTPNWFNFVGIAAEACSSGVSSAVTGAKISVWEANPMVEFKAVTKGGVIGSSMIGKRRSMNWDSTLAIAWIDCTVSSNADWRVCVTGLVDGEGDSGGYVAFRFLSRLEGNIGSSVALTSTTPVLAFFG